MFAPRPDIAEVYPGLLIGSLPGSKQRKALVKSGVTVVVDVRDEAKDEQCRWPASVTLVRSPIVDQMAPDLNELNELTEWIATSLSTGQRVLVHCHAGIGRSATVVCAVLLRLGWSITDAYSRLREVRPIAAPTDVQLNVLTAFARQVGHAPPG